MNISFGSHSLALGIGSNKLSNGGIYQPFWSVNDQMFSDVLIKRPDTKIVIETKKPKKQNRIKHINVINNEIPEGVWRQPHRSEFISKYKLYNWLRVDNFRQFKAFEC